MFKQNRIVLAIAGAVFLAIVALEMAAPANVVGAYGFVLPILLVATLRSRSLMIVTVLACIVATYMGLMQPTKPGHNSRAECEALRHRKSLKLGQGTLLSHAR